VGVAVVAERAGGEPLVPDAAAEAYLRIESMTLTFDPRPRNDDVTV
jgi:hypothetical protein